jgi:hypothetical protein
MSTKQARQYEELIAETGLTLLDVVPFCFPDHVLIKSLKAENELLRKSALTRYWRDNGPWALWRALDLSNRKNKTCRCGGACFRQSQLSLSCATWDRFRLYMSNAGIECALIHLDDKEDFMPVGAEGGCVIRHMSLKGAWCDLYRKPPGFNALTACEFMAPVSHVNVHLVVQTKGNTIGITYGRKLWECTDSLRNPELRKLDMLFGAIHGTGLLSPPSY